MTFPGDGPRPPQRPAPLGAGWPAWWMRRGAAALALLPLAALFAAAAAARRAAYRLGWARAWRAPVPVVVVGNVTAGGSGKTPLVLALARGLAAAGRHPGMVSRGYGRRRDAPDPLAVEPDTPAALAGDEPLLLRRGAGCPVWVGARRADAAAALLRAHPEVDVLLADDGLQHLALARDVEIVVVDPRGPGNGWPLPAGPLRERWDRRRDATVGPAEALAAVPGTAPRFALRRGLGAARHLASGAVRGLDDLRGVPRLAAAAGIGDPDRFFAMLEAAGLRLGATLALRDHAALGAADCAGLNADIILVTDKDALKCDASDPAFAGVWAVGLDLDLDPALIPWLLARLASHPPDTDGHPTA